MIGYCITLISSTIHTNASWKLDIFLQDLANTSSFGSTFQELSFDYLTWSNIRTFQFTFHENLKKYDKSTFH